MKPLAVAPSPVVAASAGQSQVHGMLPAAARPENPDAVTGIDDGTTTEHDLAPQGAAAAPVTRQRPLTTRCEECEGEGGWYSYGYPGAYDPDSAIRTWRECHECDGAGEFDQGDFGDED